MNGETKEKESVKEKYNLGCFGLILFWVIFISLAILGFNVIEQEHKIIEEIENYENHGKDVEKKIFYVGEIDVQFEKFKSFKPSKGSWEYYVIYEGPDIKDSSDKTYRIKISEEEYEKSKFYGTQTIKIYLSKSFLTFEDYFTYLDDKAYLLDIYSQE